MQAERASPEFAQARHRAHKGVCEEQDKAEGEIGAITCPALAIFGANTEYQEKPGKKLEILESTMKECDTKLIQKTNHWFKGKETELARTIMG